jgi:hypothetical protein
VTKPPPALHAAPDAVRVPPSGVHPSGGDLGTRWTPDGSSVGGDANGRRPRPPRRTYHCRRSRVRLRFALGWQQRHRGPEEFLLHVPDTGSEQSLQPADAERRPGCLHAPRLPQSATTAARGHRAARPICAHRRAAPGDAKDVAPPGLEHTAALPRLGPLVWSHTTSLSHQPREARLQPRQHGLPACRGQLSSSRFIALATRRTRSD